MELPGKKSAQRELIGHDQRIDIFIEKIKILIDALVHPGRGILALTCGVLIILE